GPCVPARPGYRCWLRAGRLARRAEVVVAEMRAADVPVEVLGLHIERKRVRDQRIQRGRYCAHPVGWKVSRRIEPSGSSAGFKLSHLGGHGATSWLEGHELRTRRGRPDFRQT